MRAGRLAEAIAGRAREIAAEAPPMSPELREKARMILATALPSAAPQRQDDGDASRVHRPGPGQPTEHTADGEKPIDLPAASTYAAMIDHVLACVAGRREPDRARERPPGA